MYCDYRNHVKFLEDENERIIDKLNQLIKSVLNYVKSKTYDSFRAEVEVLLETLSNFTKSINILDCLMKEIHIVKKV